MHCLTADKTALTSFSFFPANAPALAILLSAAFGSATASKKLFAEPALFYILLEREAIFRLSLLVEHDVQVVRDSF